MTASGEDYPHPCELCRVVVVVVVALESTGPSFVEVEANMLDV